MNPSAYTPQDFRWSQRDIRWAKKKLGTSGLTVGGYGCASLMANYAVNRAWLKLGIKRFARPSEFVDYANTHRFYTSTGLINWLVVDSFSGGKLRLTPNKREQFITVAQVRWGAYLHWITLLDGDLCMNPWTGKFEKRNQSIWKATGREIYFKLVP
jgi:hypothetical protein